MAVSVERTSVDHGSRDGLPTLEQRFEFSGSRVDGAALADVLMSAPLLGERSIFGKRPGADSATADGHRHIRGFSPVPGFVFDVGLRPVTDGFAVRLGQPARSRPFLDGEMLWIVADLPNGAVLDEQINTERALETVEPLSGAARSVRRWMFFRVGHKQVMQGATKNIAALIG